MTDWTDSTARLALIERVGVDTYNRMMAEQLDRSTVATVNGRAIRTVGSRFGTLFAVAGTDRAFRTRGEAEDYARSL